MFSLVTALSILSATVANAGTAVTKNVTYSGTVSDGSQVYSVTSQPSNGTLTMAANGSYTYAPNTDYVGTDAFTYTNGVLCATDGTKSSVQSTLYNLTGASDLNRTSPANLVANGDFEIGYTTPKYWGALTTFDDTFGDPAPNSVTSWTATGGGTATYAAWRSDYESSFIPGRPAGLSAPYVYFGNENIVSTSTVSTIFGASGETSIVSPESGFSINNPEANYGTIATPVVLSQNVTLVVGTKYRLSFFQGAERGVNGDGLAALDITGFDRTYFRVYTNGHRYIFEFTASASTTNIGFINWGHLKSSSGATTATSELSLDDVIINKCGTSQTVTFDVSANPPVAGSGGTTQVTSAVQPALAETGAEISLQSIFRSGIVLLGLGLIFVFVGNLRRKAKLLS